MSSYLKAICNICDGFVDLWNKQVSKIAGWN